MKRFLLFGSLLVLFMVVLPGMDFSGEKLTPVHNGKDWKERLWGFANEAGELVIPYKYTAAFPFSEGLAAVSTGKLGVGKWQYINARDEVVIAAGEPDFEWASSFHHGRALVSTGTCTYTDKNRVLSARPLPKLTPSARYNYTTRQLICKEGTLVLDSLGRPAFLTTPRGLQIFQYNLVGTSHENPIDNLVHYE